MVRLSASVEMVEVLVVGYEILKNWCSSGTRRVLSFLKLQL